MTPPAPHARFAPFDLLFVQPLAPRPVARPRARRQPLLAVAVSVAALLGSHASGGFDAGWGQAVAAIEARVEPEDLLVFDRAGTESAYLRHALRADDRRVLAAPLPYALRADLSSRRRVWLVATGNERAAARAASSFDAPGWRELERISGPGLRATLFARNGDR